VSLFRGLEAGGRWVLATQLTFDPKQVRHDVLEGWITLPAARDTYWCRSQRQQ